MADPTGSVETSAGLPQVAGGTVGRCGCVDARVVHSGGGVQVTHWHCRHDGETLRAERMHTRLVLTLLTRGACEVIDGPWRRTLDPTVAIGHRTGSTYRTRHPHGIGDQGFSIAFSPSVARAVRWPVDRPSFAVRLAPSRPVVQARLVLERLSAGRTVDALGADEVLLGLLGRSLGTPLPSDRAAHARLADRARAWLSAHYRRPVRLAEVATALNCSPFHLSRIFSEQTGTTLSRWLLHRRLLAAVDELGQCGDDLSSVALRCGFSSHSHLSARFRASFDLAPSAVRARASS